MIFSGLALSSLTASFFCGHRIAENVIKGSQRKPFRYRTMDKSDGLEEAGTFHIYYVVQENDFLNFRPGWEQG